MGNSAPSWSHTRLPGSCGTRLYPCSPPASAGSLYKAPSPPGFPCSPQRSSGRSLPPAVALHSAQRKNIRPDLEYKHWNQVHSCLVFFFKGIPIKVNLIGRSHLIPQQFLFTILYIYIYIYTHTQYITEESPLVPIEHNLNTTEYCVLLPEYCCWPCQSLYDYSVHIFWCYFQQDNVPCHKAQIMVEREIHIMDVEPTNLQQLCDAIMSIWNKISEECFQHLVESMTWRIKALLNAKGCPTRY